MDRVRGLSDAGSLRSVILKTAFWKASLPSPVAPAGTLALATKIAVAATAPSDRHSYLRMGSCGRPDWIAFARLRHSAIDAHQGLFFMGSDEVSGQKLRAASLTQLNAILACKPSIDARERQHRALARPRPSLLACCRSLRHPADPSGRTSPPRERLGLRRSSRHGSHAVGR